MQRAEAAGSVTTFDVDHRASSEGAVGFAADLRRHGARPALLAAGAELTYGELADRVDARAEQLGQDVRRLVLLSGGNDVETVVTYLAALQSRHVLWLSPPRGTGTHDALVERYRPDVIVTAIGAVADVVHAHDGSHHGLHPDLALLLSTSGSTGSPRLVRLSAANVESNAGAIAEFLGIAEDDRAITTLPLHYCYGLSVVSSHLARGASIVLTDHSVVDPCFWDLARRAGATSFAGVPHTFELLDTIGFSGAELPTLRYVTQAGGRLPADDVLRYARTGERNGWRFVVMYGQTEATARMTYLPPELATSSPASIGRPIPGGSIELRPCAEADGPGVGEIVYHGPNVMLGYADSPADLARGRDVDELRTGDLARLTEDGLYEIVGRRSRVLKLFGLRIDLQQVERALAAAGIDATCAGSDVQGLVVAVEGTTASEGIVDTVIQHAGLPARSVEVVAFDRLPRLANGKPDYVAITAAGASRAARAPLRPRRLRDIVHRSRRRRGESVVDAFREALGVDEVAGDDTFVSLGGDSMSYVEASIRLEEILGHTPRAWHVTPVRELERSASLRRRMTSVETSVLLRAAAIVLVVGSHMNVFWLRGGAHVLLAVAGFNFARFQLGRREGHDQRWLGTRSVGRIALPATLWIGIQMLTAGGYSLGTLLLVNNYTGDSHRRGGRWQYWWVEVLVQILVVLLALFSIRRVREVERRRPVLFVGAMLAVTLVLRFEIVTFGDPYNHLFRTHTVAWFFVLGWAMHVAARRRHQLVLTAVAIVAVPGFFDEPGREVLVLGGLLLLLWVPVLPVPRPLDRIAGLVAAASLYIYLTHWQVWPLALREFVPWAALPLTIGAGVTAWWLVERLTAEASRLRARLPMRR